MSKGLGWRPSASTLDKTGAIEVDDYSRTSADHIYAIGDVTDRMQLTPVAIHEAMCFVETVFRDRPTKPDYDKVATAVFSQPEIGTVGLDGGCRARALPEPRHLQDRLPAAEGHADRPLRPHADEARGRCRHRHRARRACARPGRRRDGAASRHPGQDGRDQGRFRRHHGGASDRGGGARHLRPRRRERIRDGETVAPDPEARPTIFSSPLSGDAPSSLRASPPTRWSTTARSAAFSLRPCSTRALEDGDLPVGARPLRGDLPRSARPRRGSRAVPLLRATSAMISSTRSRERHRRAAAEIDQLAADAVPLREPSVLRDQRRQILPPSLVAALQRDQHCDDRLERRGDGDAVVEAGADVGDAQLERREFRRRPEVPPDLRRVLDAAELHQEIDHAADIPRRSRKSAAGRRAAAPTEIAMR